MNFYLLIIFLLQFASSCRWPSVDVLFILDGTLNISPFQYQRQIDFITKILSQISITDEKSRVAVAQFTPSTRIEMKLADTKSNTEAIDRLERIIYSPCDVLSSKTSCAPLASINSLSRLGLAEGNRKQIPDVVVVLSTSKYILPELLPKEVLMSPQSPLFAFQVLVSDNAIASDHFPPSATTIPMGAVDFDALLHLVDPLCSSVINFVGGGGGSSTNGVAAAQFGTICWVVTAVITAVFFLILLSLIYAIYTYREENAKLRKKMVDSDRLLRSQNEYFTAKLHAQMEEQIKNGEKHSEELRKQQETMHQQLEIHRQLQTSATPAPSALPPPPPQQILIPYYGGPVPPNHSNNLNNPNNNNNNNNTTNSPTDNQNHDATKQPNTSRIAVDGNEEIQLRIEGNQLEVSNGVVSTILKQNEESPRKDPSTVRLQLSMRKDDANKEHSVHRRDDGVQTSRKDDHGLGKSTTVWRSDESDESLEEGSSMDSGIVIVPSGAHLPPDHPSRTLPPIDLLFLVDSSSSIGISNFDTIKTSICRVLDDVDIAPGRSRVSLLQFAAQPSVVFGFDKYYSLQSVKKGVMRMSYTGGATMLSKALSFAAGLLYKEQNMKDGRKRKHKLMPTPRHDRLQVLCVVSDGSSEDSIEKATNYLHDTLNIKIFAMVTRSFNKEKLLPITKYEGSIFVLDQKESISIWIWRQQRVWAEHYGSFIEREKSLPLSPKKQSPKKTKHTS